MMVRNCPQAPEQITCRPLLTPANTQQYLVLFDECTYFTIITEVRSMEHCSFRCSWNPNRIPANCTCCTLVQCIKFCNILFIQHKIIQLRIGLNPSWCCRFRKGNKAAVFQKDELRIREYSNGHTPSGVTNGEEFERGLCRTLIESMFSSVSQSSLCYYQSVRLTFCAKV
jgi:hypothetical protein